MKLMIAKLNKDGKVKIVGYKRIDTLRMVLPDFIIDLRNKEIKDVFNKRSV